MSSVSGIRLPGLATGMDTETMIKEMLTGEQNKIDKAKQQEQKIEWQQEIYREIIGDIKDFQDTYLSMTSPNSIISSSAWNTLTVNSSNSNIITATGTAGASNVNYKFEVDKLAESAKVSVKGATIIDGEEIKLTPDTKLSDLKLDSETSFSIKFGDGENEVSESITIGPEDTIDTLMKKINGSTDGQVKASYSEMTGELTIQGTKTGENSKLQIVQTQTDDNGDEIRTLTKEDGSSEDVIIKKDADGNEKVYKMDGTTEIELGEKDKLSIKTEPSDALSFLGIDSSERIGSNSNIIVKDSEGNKIKTINEESNTFTIDGIKYNVHTTGEADITSKQDVQPVVDNMKKFVEDYNKIMDEVYDLVTQRTNPDYPPLTEAQRKDMSEEEIKNWEEKAKEGLLKNDSEMRRFMDHMKGAIFGDHSEALREFGLTTHEDYTKQGQLSLDIDKFTKALENNGDKVYEIFAGSENSVMESMKDTMYDYVGTSSSVFAKKAGLEKTASAVNNFYSEQLKKQQEIIKELQRKMTDKENDLYKEFGQLEASMNKLNSQMSYFMQA